MKCPKNKKHKMTLLLGPPGEDVGWECQNCQGEDYWPLEGEELAIWRNGVLWGEDGCKMQVELAKRFLEVRRSLGIV